MAVATLLALQLVYIVQRSKPETHGNSRFLFQFPFLFANKSLLNIGMVGFDGGIGLIDRHEYLTGQEKKWLFDQAAVLRKTGFSC